MQFCESDGLLLLLDYMKYFGALRMIAKLFHSFHQFFLTNYMLNL